MTIYGLFLKSEQTEVFFIYIIAQRLGMHPEDVKCNVIVLTLLKVEILEHKQNTGN